MENKKVKYRIILLSYLTAFIIVLFVFAVTSSARAESYTNSLDNSYGKSLNELGGYIEGVSTDLNKVLYSNSNSQLIIHLTGVIKNSAAAKSCLASLPISELNLENTYKFLSQSGDYAYSMMKSLAKGGELTPEEQDTFKSLHEYSKTLVDHIYVVIDDIQKSAVSISEITFGNLNDGDPESDDSENANSVSMADGFVDMENGFEGYPSLVYDGAFSDHIMQIEPKLIQNEPEVDLETALNTASKILNLPPKNMKILEEEGGHMPLYRFESEESSIGITKRGGLPAYMVNSRNVSIVRIKDSEAFRSAEEFLKAIGYTNLSKNYHETRNNIMTINFAHTEGDIKIYPDLIKVSVALDKGEIVGFDARGYIANNTDRAIPEPLVTSDEARNAINPALNLKEGGLAIIPTEGLNEKLCYEFLCSGENDQNVLIYVDALTGIEEKILILIESESGVLTI